MNTEEVKNLKEAPLPKANKIWNSLKRIGTYSVRVEKKLFKTGDRTGPSKRSVELQRNLPECLGRPKLDLPQHKTSTPEPGKTAAS